MTKSAPKDPFLKITVEYAGRASVDVFITEDCYRYSEPSTIRLAVEKAIKTCEKIVAERMRR